MDELAIARAQLHHRMTLLLAQLRVWLRNSRTESSKYARHRSQIRAFYRLLFPVLRKIRDAAADKEATVADVRMLSLDLLALFRVWEFLRSKLAQRSDLDLARALEMADDFAWSCFEKVAQTAFREPPLVFLNGGFSPYMVPRHKTFQAERVTGDARESQVIQSLTSDLPFPVIGLPWYQTSAIWDLPLVAHEVGHVVEEDLGLEVEETVGAAVSDADRKKDWERWAGEIFGDYYATVAVDSAFTSALASFLAGAGSNGVPPEYPPSALRFHLNLHFLPDDAQVEKDRMKDRWEKEFPIEPAYRKHADDCAAVAGALRTLDVSLAHVDTKRRNRAKSLTDLICGHSDLQGKTYDTRDVVMAARGVFDRLIGSSPFERVVERCQELGPVLSESVKKRARAREEETVDQAAKAAAEARRAQAWSERFCSVRR